MLFLVIGLPDRFVRHCQDLAIRLVRRAFGPAELFDANTLDEIGRKLLLGGVPHAVVAAHQPGGGLRRALSEIAQRFIVVLDNPLPALANLVADREVPLAAATRMVASSCGSFRCFCDTPGALILRADQTGSDDSHRLAATIAQHLELDLPSEAVAEIVRCADPVAAGYDQQAAAAWWDGLDPAERAMTAGALGVYLDPAADMSGPLSWAPALFFAGDQSTEPLSGSIDITGRARRLLRGPHIMLPPGNWSLAATFDFSADAADHSFVVEITAGASLARVVIRPPEAGIFEIQQSLTIEDLPERPIELRLHSERPAFGGELTLLGVTLTPQTAQTTATTTPLANGEQ